MPLFADQIAPRRSPLATAWLACALAAVPLGGWTAAADEAARGNPPEIQAGAAHDVAGDASVSQDVVSFDDLAEVETEIFAPAFDLSPDEARRGHDRLRRDEQAFRASLIDAPRDAEEDRLADLETLRESQSISPYISGDERLAVPIVLDDGELPPGAFCDCDVCRPWDWTVLPEGLIYRSYLAGVKEPRFTSFWFNEPGFGWLWDSTLGGRAGLLRYGNHSAIDPQGLQIDIEGAGMPRLGLDDNRRELVSADFRFGVPITYGDGQWQYKLAYYHLSSHLGDEFMLRTGTVRNDFTLDVFVLGASYFPLESVRVYGEAGYAINTGGGSEPWEFQFGAEFAPPCATGCRGAPFLAVNAHLREEVDFGGNLVLQAGWAWRNPVGRLFRIGVQYYNGHSSQYEFFKTHEEQLGAGIWYDF